MKWKLDRSGLNYWFLQFYFLIPLTQVYFHFNAIINKCPYKAPKKAVSDPTNANNVFSIKTLLEKQKALYDVVVKDRR